VKALFEFFNVTLARYIEPIVRSIIICPSIAMSLGVFAYNQLIA